MEHLSITSEEWGWTGIKPREIVRQNGFGNLLVEDERGGYWRIGPEELSCILIANDSHQFEQLEDDDDFQHDWEMAKLTAEAKASLGEPGDGRCFYLKIPAVLGGEYAIDNIGQISLTELISVSGDTAKQIEELPDGTRIKIKLVD